MEHGFRGGGWNLETGFFFASSHDKGNPPERVFYFRLEKKRTETLNGVRGTLRNWIECPVGPFNGARGIAFIPRLSA